MRVKSFFKPFFLASVTLTLLIMLPNSLSAQVALAKKNVDTVRIEQIDHTAKMFVESARPLASAALELANKHGWQINYEDPAFLDTQDLQDVTAFVSRIPNPERRVLYPRGGTLETEFPLSDGKPENPAVILQSLIEEHHKKGNPGVFRLKQNGAVLTIIPTAVKDKKGELVTEKPLMGTHISVLIHDGTLEDIVHAITEAVTQTTGTRVGLFDAPINFFFQTKVRLKTSSGTAHDLLQSALDASGYELAWQLRCEPNFCGLNVFFVTKK